LRLFLLPDAHIVGHNEHSLPEVRCADTDSWNHKRRCFVALGLQIRQRLVKSHPHEASNILTNDPSGVELFNNAQHFRPEVASISRPSALSCRGEGLTGETARDEVNVTASANPML